jgi:NADH-quinone oxidoreductase subunit K
MVNISIETGFMIAGILFLLGFLGVMVRRNVIFALIGIEIMLNAAGFAFILAGAKWGQPDGQVMYLFILTMTAAEVAVGLALIVCLFRNLGTLDTDSFKLLKH